MEKESPSNRVLCIMKTKYIIVKVWRGCFFVLLFYFSANYVHKAYTLPPLCLPPSQGAPFPASGLTSSWPCFRHLFLACSCLFFSTLKGSHRFPSCMMVRIMDCFCEQHGKGENRWAFWKQQELGAPEGSLCPNFNSKSSWCGNSWL